MLPIAAAVTRIPLLDKVQKEIIQPIILLLFAAALLYFLWGVAEFIRGSGSEEARQTGAQHMLWGVIGMFIMVSVYGILNLICNTIGAGC